MSLLPYDQLEKLSRIYDSSFYLFSEERLAENFRRIQKAFQSVYPNLIIGYSYKTNYLPYLCKKVDQWGAYAEVVSRMEYDLAMKVVKDPRRIIVNGPLKHFDDLAVAFSNRNIVNLDSFYEIDLVRQYCQLYPDQEVKVGIRINADISERGISPLQNGYPVSRFGFCVENGNAAFAIRELRNIQHVRVVGLHGHFSTNRSVRNYEKITSILSFLAREHLAEHIEYIDIGGGFYGNIPDSFGISNVPTFDDYAEAVGKIVNQELVSYGIQPTLIIEPGISLVADVFTFACRVVDSKQNRDHTFVLVDGSVNNVKPTMHDNNLPYHVIRRSSHLHEGRFHVVGYTCMEKDYLLKNVEGIMPQVGDYIVFENVGAYTIVFQPPFIKGRPPIFGYDRDGSYLILRAKEGFNEFFPATMYEFETPIQINV